MCLLYSIKFIVEYCVCFSLQCIKINKICCMGQQPLQKSPQTAYYDCVCRNSCLPGQPLTLLRNSTPFPSHHQNAKADHHDIRGFTNNQSNRWKDRLISQNNNDRQRQTSNLGSRQGWMSLGRQRVDFYCFRVHIPPVHSNRWIEIYQWRKTAMPWTVRVLQHQVRQEDFTCQQNQYQLSVYTEHVEARLAHFALSRSQPSKTPVATQQQIRRHQMSLGQQQKYVGTHQKYLSIEQYEQQIVIQQQQGKPQQPQIIQKYPSLNLNEAIYWLINALQAYQLLSQQYLVSYPTALSMGVTVEGQIKAWINDNWASNQEQIRIIQESLLIEELITVVQERTEDSLSSIVNSKFSYMTYTFDHLQSLLAKRTLEYHKGRQSLIEKLNQFKQKQSSLKKQQRKISVNKSKGKTNQQPSLQYGKQNAVQLPKQTLIQPHKQAQLEQNNRNQQKFSVKTYLSAQLQQPRTTNQRINNQYRHTNKRITFSGTNQQTHIQYYYAGQQTSFNKSQQITKIANSSPTVKVPNNFQNARASHTKVANLEQKIGAPIQGPLINHEVMPVRKYSINQRTTGQSPQRYHLSYYNSRNKADRPVDHHNTERPVTSSSSLMQSYATRQTLPLNTNYTANAYSLQNQLRATLKSTDGITINNLRPNQVIRPSNNMTSQGMTLNANLQRYINKNLQRNTNNNIQRQMNNNLQRYIAMRLGNKPLPQIPGSVPTNKVRSNSDWTIPEPSLTHNQQSTLSRHLQHISNSPTIKKIEVRASGTIKQHQHPASFSPLSLLYQPISATPVKHHSQSKQKYYNNQQKQIGSAEPTRQGQKIGSAESARQQQKVRSRCFGGPEEDGQNSLSLITQQFKLLLQSDQKIEGEEKQLQEGLQIQQFLSLFSQDRPRSGPDRNNEWAAEQQQKGWAYSQHK